MLLRSREERNEEPVLDYEEEGVMRCRKGSRIEAHVPQLKETTQ